MKHLLVLILLCLRAFSHFGMTSPLKDKDVNSPKAANPLTK